MSDGLVTPGALKRLSYIPNEKHPGEKDGLLIAGQNYYDVNFTGGSISNVTLTNVAFSGAEGFVPGTVTMPGISFVGDSSTGFYHPANGQLGFSVAGVQAALLTATGLFLNNVSAATGAFAGSISVGAPGFAASGTSFQGTGSNNGTYQVEVQNSSTGIMASSDVVATANNGNDTTQYIDMGVNGSGFADPTWTVNGADDAYLYASDGELAIGTASAKPLDFFTGGTLAANKRMTILSGGNVGIGKTNPTTALDVNGTITGTALAGPLTGNVTGNLNGTVGAGAANTGTFTTLSATVSISGSLNGSVGAGTPNTGAFTTLSASSGIAGSFNGSVGATTPNTGSFTTLAATGTTPTLGQTANTATTLRINAASSGTNGGSGIFLQAAGVTYAAFSAYSSYFGGTYNSTPTIVTSGLPLDFITSGSTANMRLDTSGNVLIGKTTSSLTTTGFEYSGASGHFTASAAECCSFDRETSDGATVSYRRANTTVGSVSVTATAATYNTTSDYRLKEVRPVGKPATDTLMGIPVYSGHFKADPKKQQLMLLAHELQEHMPEAVTGVKDATDENGAIIPQMVDYSKIVTGLLLMNQEQQEIIENLQVRLTALENK